LNLSGPMSFANASGSNLNLTGTLSANMCKANAFDLIGGNFTYNSTNTRGYIALGGCSGWGPTTLGTPTPSTYALSNGLELCGTRFNATTTQYHQWAGVLAADYATGTPLTFDFYWSATGTTIGSTVFSMRALVATSTDVMSTISWGPWVTSSQPFVGKDMGLAVSTSSVVLTPGGALVPNGAIQFEVRTGSDVGQTIGTDAILRDVKGRYQQRTGITER
jgi:hypothetical protein